MNWLDYGWRNYDAQLGRWHGIDALADRYHEFSPYHYVLNNPISNIDPDGREIIINVQYQKDDNDDYVLDENGNKIISGLNITLTGKVAFRDKKESKGKWSTEKKTKPCRQLE